MKKQNILLFANKYHALKYILNNLRKNYMRVVLPSVIGQRENDIFANMFMELAYYHFNDYAPDYEEIKNLMNKNSLLYLKDIYICNKETERKVIEELSLVIKEDNYIFNEYIKGVNNNVILTGYVNLFYRKPLGVYVKGNEYLDYNNYMDLPRIKERFSFRVSNNFYNFLKGNEGVLDLIDEYIDIMGKSKSPRLPRFMEKRILKADIKNISRDYKKIGEKLHSGINNHHFRILFCKECIYSSLIILVRDRNSLLTYLNDNRIKPISYFNDDLPINKEGEKFNDALVIISLAHFLQNEKETDRLIDILNRW